MIARGPLLALLGLAAVFGVLVGAIYGVPDGLITGALLAVLGVATLAAAGSVAGRRAAMGPLRRQFAVAIAIVVGQVSIALVAGAALMFVSPHDVLLALLLVAFAGVAGVLAARRLAAGVMGDIDALRRTFVAVGEGEREPVPATGTSDELADLTAAANVAIARLRSAEGARADLIAAVSHDLRTPITSMRLLAAAIDDDIVDEETRHRYTREMTLHIEGLSGLIDDLFELARLEAGELAWSLEKVRLDQLMGETVEAMQPQARAKGIRVEAVLDGVRTAQGNPEKLQRVLFNLIQNAIRHTPQDGSVTVTATAHAAADSVQIEVADTGDGIAAGDRERVFEPFYRAGAEAARTRSGAGLGLAISRAIVEAHGGRIWLEDAPLGTRVRFTVPRTPAR
ncbi:MAG: HAMP domain-containing sensor histidine kinase [Solirubrobacteraceae bacterium]